MTSYLYIIASDPAGPVKLGLSVAPDKRVRQLQTACPKQLVVYHTEEVEDDRVKIAESALHRLLGHRRMKGAWFDMTVEEAIAEVMFIRMEQGREKGREQSRPSPEACLSGAGAP